jgi:hypothetical protein
MTKRTLAFTTLALLIAAAASADVALVERKSLTHDFPTKAKPDHAHRGAPTRATGSQGLVDNTGLKYFINTDITFSTTSSASPFFVWRAARGYGIGASTVNYLYTICCLLEDPCSPSRRAAT